MYTLFFHARLAILAIILTLSSYNPVIAQAKDEVLFPASWVGIWKGQLEIYGGTGLKQSLPMELHVRPQDSTDHYDWWIIYGEDKEAGKRAYELVPKDKANGVWVVDEKNSIKLECYYYHDKLSSWYDVKGSLILVTNEVRGDEMIFEVIAGSLAPVSITGNAKHEGEDIPEVRTYPVNVLQRAKLRRE